jgi:chaperonin GroES
MALRPLSDRILIRREVAEAKTRGGVYLPETAKKKPQMGTVVAVGPGKTNKDGSVTPLTVKVNDKVLFTSWAGDEFKDAKAKDELLVMRESDVLAVIA